MPASRALESGRGLCMSASRGPDGAGTKQQQTEMLKQVDLQVPTDGQFPSACPPSPGRMNGHAPSSQSTALPRAISRPIAHARASGEQTSGSSLMHSPGTGVCAFPAKQATTFGERACFSNEWVWWAAAVCLWVRGGPGGTWRIRGEGRGLQARARGVCLCASWTRLTLTVPGVIVGCFWRWRSRQRHTHGYLGLSPAALACRNGSCRVATPPPPLISPPLSSSHLKSFRPLSTYERRMPSEHATAGIRAPQRSRRTPQRYS